VTKSCVRKTITDRTRNPYLVSFLTKITLLFICLFWIAQPSFGLDIMLSWNQNSDADHYIIYWDTTSKTGTSPIEYTYSSSVIDGEITSHTISGLSNQTYYFAIRAFNSCGNASEYSTEIIRPEQTNNVVPSAHAGFDQNIQAGSTVLLDGSGSSDPENQISSYQWLQTEGPSVILEGSGSAEAQFTAPEQDVTLQFQLTVTDQGDLTSSDVCIVYITTTPVGSGGGDPDPDIPPDDSGTETPENDELADAPQSPDSLITNLQGSPSIEVFDSNFKHLEWLKIGWEEYINANGEARVTTGDIDGDGEYEIIIGMGPVTSDPGIPGGFFQIIDHDFSHMVWGRVSWPEYNETNGETWPACGDLDGDGDDEIIIGLGQGGDGTLEIFDYQSGVLIHEDWAYVNWPEYNELLGETRPVCGDLDNDGKDEIIIGLGSMEEDTLNHGRFEIKDHSLTHKTWGQVHWEEYNHLNGESWAATGDIDGDGDSEIIIGLGRGGEGKLEFFDYTGDVAEHIGWAQIDWTDYNTDYGETRPVSGDIDGDGRDEIIVGLGPVIHEPEIPQGYFKVIDDDFTNIEWGQIDWADFNEVNGESRPVSGSINGNDKVIIGLGTWNVSTDTGSSPVKTDISGIGEAAGGGGGGCFISSMMNL